VPPSAVLSLPVLRQQRFGLLQQLRAGKGVEEIHRLEPFGPASDAKLMLLRLKSGTTISQGWPRGWWAGCLVTNILPIPASLPHIFQSLTVRCSPRLPLSRWSLSLGRGTPAQLAGPFCLTFNCTFASILV